MNIEVLDEAERHLLNGVSNVLDTDIRNTLVRHMLVKCFIQKKVLDF